ncbi:hypothetical protein G7Y89_g12964 [Cudoniella acicularis]|uniref:RING-type domain-containing protein n=1 Tax=Cudoniella acicularis TaxID=354080 RepID=A0A8H4R852_9HELO|nr:hypothetical protein G7Y89_g12964 [Cudoniella acicularis]
MAYTGMPCNHYVTFYHTCHHARSEYKHNQETCRLPPPRLTESDHSHSFCIILSNLSHDMKPEDPATHNGIPVACPKCRWFPCQVMEPVVKYSYGRCPECTVNRPPRGRTTALLRILRQVWWELADRFKTIWVNSYFHPRRAARRAEWLARWANFHRSSSLLLYHPEDRTGFLYEIPLSSIPEDSRDCSICQDEMVTDDIARLPCGHLFHFACVKKWFGGPELPRGQAGNHNTCPMCRRAYSLMRTPSWDDPVWGAEHQAPNRGRNWRTQTHGYVPFNRNIWEQHMTYEQGENRRFNEYQDLQNAIREVDEMDRGDPGLRYITESEIEEDPPSTTRGRHTLRSEQIIDSSARYSTQPWTPWVPPTSTNTSSAPSNPAAQGQAFNIPATNPLGASATSSKQTRSFNEPSRFWESYFGITPSVFISNDTQGRQNGLSRSGGSSFGTLSSSPAGKNTQGWQIGPPRPAGSPSGTPSSSFAGNDTQDQQQGPQRMALESPLPFMTLSFNNLYISNFYVHHSCSCPDCNKAGEHH